MNRRLGKDEGPAGGGSRRRPRRRTPTGAEVLQLADESVRRCYLLIGTVRLGNKLKSPGTLRQFVRKK